MEQYSLRIASPQDALIIWQVMDLCYKSLENQSCFICDTPDYVSDLLSHGGFGVVACDLFGNIVGNLLIKYPGLSEDNLGYDLSFTVPDLLKVAHMDSCSVLPRARGNQLEAKMLSYAEALINPDHHYFLLATVSPENIPSIKSLQKVGYKIMMTKEKYEGVLRHIVMKKLRNSLDNG